MITLHTPRGTVVARIVAREREHTLTPTIIARVVLTTDDVYRIDAVVETTGRCLP